MTLLCALMYDKHGPTPVLHGQHLNDAILVPIDLPCSAGTGITIVRTTVPHEVDLNVCASRRTEIFSQYLTSING